MGLVATAIEEPTTQPEAETVKEVKVTGPRKRRKGEKKSSGGLSIDRTVGKSL